jgi:predicted site-specific integrase-resolvase
MQYLTSGKICDLLQISKQTLKRWKDDGKIKFKQVSPRKVLYDASDFVENSTTENVVAVYGRVSLPKQKADLVRQIDTLKEYAVKNGFVVKEVISDVASGMNENRHGLDRLFQLVETKQINSVIVTYKDRLSRFGFGYFEKWFSTYGVKIIVVNLTGEEDYQKELVDDIVTILHHFSMKLYSHRRTIVTKCKKLIQTENSN